MPEVEQKRDALSNKGKQERSCNTPSKPIHFSENGCITKAVDEDGEVVVPSYAYLLKYVLQSSSVVLTSSLLVFLSLSDAPFNRGQVRRPDRLNQR